MTWPLVFATVAGICLGLAVSTWHDERPAALSCLAYAAIAFACMRALS